MDKRRKQVKQTRKKTEKVNRAKDEELNRQVRKKAGKGVPQGYMPFKITDLE